MKIEIDIHEWYREQVKKARERYYRAIAEKGLIWV